MAIRAATAIGSAAFVFTLTSLLVLLLCSHLFSPTLLCWCSASKMVRPRDRSGKRKADSPPTLPHSEEDVAALQQHRRAVGERRSKSREDTRRVGSSRSKELVRRASPPPKRSRIIEVTSSEEEAEDGDHSRGESGRAQSWRYGALFSPNFGHFFVSAVARVHSVSMSRYFC